MRDHGSVGVFRNGSKLRAAAVAVTLLATTPAISSARTETAPALLDTPTFNNNITMIFTGPVNVGRTTLSVYGPHGRVLVGTLKRGSNEGELVIPVSGDLAPGLYVVHFQAFSDWGASMSGTSTVEVPARPPLNAYIDGRGMADASGGE